MIIKFPQNGHLPASKKSILEPTLRNVGGNIIKADSLFAHFRISTPSRGVLEYILYGNDPRDFFYCILREYMICIGDKCFSCGWSRGIDLDAYETTELIYERLDIRDGSKPFCELMPIVKNDFDWLIKMQLRFENGLLLSDLKDAVALLNLCFGKVLGSAIKVSASYNIIEFLQHLRQIDCELTISEIFGGQILKSETNMI